LEGVADGIDERSKPFKEPGIDVNSLSAETGRLTPEDDFPDGLFEKAG
jgi:hypothetical protein